MSTKHRGPDTRCVPSTTVGRGLSETGLHGTSSAQHEDHRVDDRASSRRPSVNDLMVLVSLERTEPVELIWHGERDK
ncbi:hypothetical protein ANCDUO_06049 [Ancylostoma duodenale]|uniref:Uncharacterized protein n=1 Tax=Ancylostoma duodenale TaxID=51022 RepID=A0A0C2DM08_9BILA|nr:hypothetical protein ANCDUO_06049 [Ancylostoma duodenale]